jgi:hypothetical protein
VLRALFLSGGVLLMALGVGGLTRQPLPAAQQALVNHFTNNDPAWTILDKAKVAQDLAKGVLTAAFPPEVAGLSGKSLRISGFMLPLEATTQTRHFILTRRSVTCPFCPPNAPTEAVEVELDTPVAFTNELVAVEGRLALTSASDRGLFYRLTSASIANMQ